MSIADLSRLAASRAVGASVSAVSAVGAVDRTRRNAPIDPALPTDLRDLGWIRPDPASIPAVDIARFEALVYGATNGQPLFYRASEAESAGPAAAHAWIADVGPSADATPADRIAHTLQHLRGIRGL